MKHRPKGSMCVTCAHALRNCSHLPFEAMPVIARDRDGVSVVRCGDFMRAGNDRDSTRLLSNLAGAYPNNTLVQAAYRAYLAQSLTSNEALAEVFEALIEFQQARIAEDLHKAMMAPLSPMLGKFNTTV
ncbi:MULTISPECIES: hypothetical protein [Pseudomonas]|uniref:Uncharacterized protein n=1 Tax=Pseudomonas lutea TaxID=243924 RepID=A0A9X8MH39_9PSED|nr:MULTISPECIES: hypothetical protein [Pseudomonas]SER36714.1 hypothetical protein SAMN05216409_11864 [Pseudomonas lutea]